MMSVYLNNDLSAPNQIKK